MKDLNRLREQVKAAWAKLPIEVRAKLEARMVSAHLHALAVRSQTVSALARPPHRELLMLHSLLHDDPDALLATSAAAAPEGVLTYVGADGAVYFGGVEYDSTDPGWAYCLPAMVFTEDSMPPFEIGNVTKIPDTATFGILGDWGGWNAPAQSIGAAAKSSDYLIHIGDVYYAGTNGDVLLDPYESTHFVDDWPGVAGRSFALNSNHDMYAHATGYSLTTLTAPAFSAQGGNCFALYNKAFRIVGLDSAYYAPDNSLEDFPGYMKGYLGDGDQMVFLQEQIGQLTSGQNLILLTHHNGLNLDGSVPTEGDDPYQLWQQVTQVLQQIPAGASKSVLWYWGHEHAGAVYVSQQIDGITIYPRCCGHGCIPWGIATDLSQSGNVLWYEKQNLGPGDNYFVTNGYATLALKGTSLTESFCNQDGKQSWSGSPMMT
jgi:hypothetical protein